MHARTHTLALCAGQNKGMRKGVRNAVKYTDKTVRQYKPSYVELQTDCCFIFVYTTQKPLTREQ